MAIFLAEKYFWKLYGKQDYRITGLQDRQNPETVGNPRFLQF
jgi:hypothetical protein